MIAIGIDPGVETGVAVWDLELAELTCCESMHLHQALEHVLKLAPAIVIFEDARLRTWFGNSRVEQYGKGAREGVGSVKRDCVIWEQFLIDHAIAFHARKPARGGTKWTAPAFKNLTHWPGRTNEHARDAALLVVGLNRPTLEGLLRPPAPLVSIALFKTAGKRRAAP